MLKLYDYLEAMIEERNRRYWFFETKLNFYASEIMQSLDIEDADDIASSLNRAFRACETLQIPLNRNFKRVYCSDGKNLNLDWKISAFACYLIIINCNPRHESVAKAQLYFAMNQPRHK
jgi:DNA-damage-inducible protein D